MTDIRCNDCGHVRETTEPYPTLANCEACGSSDVDYALTDGDKTPPDALPDAEIRAELDALQHTMYTCDPIGDQSRARDADREAALKDALNGTYEHDPDSCAECKREREIIDRHRQHDDNHD